MIAPITQTIRNCSIWQRTLLHEHPSRLGPRYSFLLGRLVRVLPVALLISIGAASSAIAQSALFSPIEPFLGARYGMGYDTAAQAPSRAGQSCVNFDPTKTNSEQDGRNENRSTTITRSSDLVKAMDLSAMAQVKALTGTYEAKSTLEIANKTEVHQFSETKIFYNYKRNDTVLLLTEAISIKPEYQTLLGKGILGLDEFRAKCGNAFVVGQQTGAYYFGTAYKSSATSSSSRRLNLNFEFSYKGGYEFDAKMALAIDEQRKAQDEKVEFFSKTTDMKLAAPRNASEIEEQWVKFSPPSSEDSIIEAVIAPYTVAKGALPEGLLAGTTDMKKLEVLLEALWDLKTLRDEAQYILKKPDQFALGLPTGSKREARLSNVRTLHQQWRTEFDQLLANTKDCVSAFTDKCTKLANSYESNPRISQESLLPKKYRSYCYGKFEVRLTNEPDPSDDRFMALLGPIRGDAEMGGGPVLVRSDLRITPDGSQLRMWLKVNIEEAKSDHTTFEGGQGVVVFDLKPKEAGMDNPFEECEFADHPVTAKPIKAPNTYGAVAARSAKHPREFVTFNGRGMLSQISCKLDTPGDENGELFCKPPQVQNLQVLLVSRLDRDAEQWQPLLIVDKVFLHIIKKPKHEFKIIPH